MYKDGRLYCDRCQSPITRVTPPPEDGWPKLTNICTTCYANVAKLAVPRN
jgi:hypothetical protein